MMTGALDPSFGHLSLPLPTPARRGPFRIAVLGDFSARAARGVREIGDALATRRIIPLDVDTIDDVIAGFGMTLRLPIGKDGAGVDLNLSSLDDLHPDEVFDSADIFGELKGLRQQLGVQSMAGAVRDRLTAWSRDFGTPITLPRQSRATSVPADLKLSDFQALIGDTSRASAPAPGPIDALIAQVVGPHVVESPDVDTAQLGQAIDDAMASALRMVLHHPDFQAIEAQWRTLDMLTRRVETDETLQILLVDLSAEELAMDLAAQDDLAQSGLFRLLHGADLSAVIGLYTFEETPPHAALLGRVAQIAAHVDAPFVTAMATGILDRLPEDRHPLVADAWDALKALPEAGYLGLCAPRFLLRHPYGAKTDPIDAFAFEEFTAQEGLSGLLWGNPAVLVAILLAESYQRNGPSMDLGRIMSVPDLPYHIVTDRHGDQVALPCTERNLSEAQTQAAIARGLMPFVWEKGTPNARLASFRALPGQPLAGAWSGHTQVVPSAPKAPPTLSMTIPAQVDALDSLLAEYSETAAPPGGDISIDPELAALLESL